MFLNFPVSDTSVPIGSRYVAKILRNLTACVQVLIVLKTRAQEFNMEGHYRSEGVRSVTTRTFPNLFSCLSTYTWMSQAVSFA